MDFINELDANILIYIQEHVRNNTLDGLFIGFTNLGNGGILWLVVSLILICFKKTRKIGITCGISLLIGFLITNITLKNLVARVRPFYTIDGLTTLISYPKDYSFPSGHTTSWFASSTGIFLTTNKKFSCILLILAVVMGFSRLYVGVHYPTDVIAGIIIGVLSGEISNRVVKLWFDK